MTWPAGFDVVIYLYFITLVGYFVLFWGRIGWPNLARVLTTLFLGSLSLSLCRCAHTLPYLSLRFSFFRSPFLTLAVSVEQTVSVVPDRSDPRGHDQVDDGHQRPDLQPVPQELHPAGGQLLGPGVSCNIAAVAAVVVACAPYNSVDGCDV